MANYFEDLELEDAVAPATASNIVTGPENFFAETANEAPARPGVNETIIPKTPGKPAWQDELLQGMSIDSARESAKALSAARKANPRPQEPIEVSEQASFWGALRENATDMQVEASIDTLDALTDATGYQFFSNWGKGIKESIGTDNSDYKSVFEGFRQVGGLKDAWGYAKEAVGGVVGGMLPAFVGGGAGAAIGSAAGPGGAIVGGTAGFMASSSPLHVSDMRRALLAQGMTDKSELTKYTFFGAAALTLLDTAYPVMAATRAGGAAKRLIASKVAEKMAEVSAKTGAMPNPITFVKSFGAELSKLAAFESVAEVGQEAITTFGSKAAAGKEITKGDLEKFALETAPEVMMRTMLGAGFMSIPGAALKGAADVKEARQRVLDERASGSADPATDGLPPPEMLDGQPSPAEVARQAALNPQQAAPYTDVAPSQAAKGVTALQFIKANGGLQPAGELRALDAQRYPGLINSGGLSADAMREKLVEAGYLEESGPDQPAITTPADVYDIVQRSISGERIVPVADQHADDSFFAERDAADQRKELEYNEQQFVWPEIEELDAAAPQPYLASLYRSLKPDERIEVIERSRRGEHIDDILEEVAIRNVDVEAVSAMVAARGPDPAMVDRFRAMLAQQAPDLLDKFDEVLATFPQRQPRAPRRESALPPPAEVAASPETYAAYDRAVDALDANAFNASISRMDTASLRTLANRLGLRLPARAARGTLVEKLTSQFTMEVREAEKRGRTREIFGSEGMNAADEKLVAEGRQVAVTRYRDALARRTADIVSGGEQNTLTGHLAAVAGDEAAFNLLLTEMEGDRKVLKAQIRQVAVDLTGIEPKASATRAAMFEQIRKNRPQVSDVGGGTQSAAQATLAPGNDAGAKLLPSPPAVPVQRSVQPAFLASLADGSHITDLVDHLDRRGITLDAYQRAYSLPDDYPTLAPNVVAERYNSSGARAHESYEQFEKRFTVGAVREKLILDEMRPSIAALKPAEKLAFAAVVFPRREFRSGPEVMKAVDYMISATKREAARASVAAGESPADPGRGRGDLESTRALFESAIAAARPAQEAAPARDIKQELTQLILSKTPANQWAPQLGLSDAQLAPHIESAIRSGLMTRDHHGVPRRAPAAREGFQPEQVLADLNTLFAQTDFEQETVRIGDRDITRAKDSALRAWIGAGQEMAAKLQAMSKADATRVATQFMGMGGLSSQQRSSRVKLAKVVAGRFENMGDSFLKRAAQSGRSAALIAPGPIAGAQVTLTDRAASKIDILQKVAEDALKGILPAGVRIDVQQSIEVSRLAREDDLYALRSYPSDTLEETKDGDEDGLPSAGGHPGAQGDAANPAGRGDRETARPGGVSTTGVASAAERRILRSESATLRSDGSIIAGRPSTKGRSADARASDAGALQSIGTFERFDADGFVGVVSTANVTDHQSLRARNARPSEFRLATLSYRLYDKAAPITDSMLAKNFQPNFRADGDSHTPLIWARVSQHMDGSWEVSMVQRLADRESAPKGMADKLYAAIEKDLGIHMSPSGILSEQGYAMWKKRSPESVKWHQWSEFEGYFISPRRIKDNLDAIGKEMRAIAARTAESPQDEIDRALDLKNAQKERGELIKLWVKLPIEARAETPNMFSLTAYHGTRHDFDRFSMDKVGTGEGAQVFGHGLYFAENENVADAYKTQLGGFDIYIDGEPFLVGGEQVGDTGVAIVNSALIAYDGQVSRALQGAIQLQRALKNMGNDAAAAKYQSEIDALRQFVGDVDRRPAGIVYEVEIDVEPGDLLDYDAPLSKQSPKVLKAIEAKFSKIIKARWDDFSLDEGTLAEAMESYTGGELYGFLIDESIPYGRVIDEDGLGRIPKEDREDAQVGASKLLREAGIPGLRFLDQGSRDSFDDIAATRNIVVFDDKLVKITKKNGEPVTAAERQDAVDQLFSLGRGAEDNNVMGMTDPHANLISLGARAIEGEARATGKSMTRVTIETARHEALELFRKHGIITDLEWSALRRAAWAEGWVGNMGTKVAAYKKRFPDLGPREWNDLIIKEAIADKFGAYTQGAYKPKGLIAAAFKRAWNVIQRLMSGLTGAGFNSWEDIFRKIDAGEMKARYEAIYGTGEHFADSAKSPDLRAAAADSGESQPMIRAGQLPGARGLQPAAGAQPAQVRPPSAAALAREFLTGAPANARVTGQLRGITDILGQLGRVLNLQMRTGRLADSIKAQARAAGGQAMGQYNGVARTAIARDIDTLGHEGGHHLFRTLPGLMPLTTAHAAELMPIASPGNPGMEGFPEFLRLYVTNEAEARRVAPRFFAAFERLVDAQNPRMLADLQEIQAAYEQFLIGDPLEQGIANQTIIHSEPSGPSAPFVRYMRDAERDGVLDTTADRLSWLYQQVINRNHGFWLAQRGLLEGIQARTGQRLTLDAQDSPNKLLKLAPHSNAWAQQALKDGFALGSRPNGGGVSMHQILATAFGGTQRGQWNQRAAEEFGEYLIARNAIQEYIRFNPALRTHVQAYIAANPQLNFLSARLPLNTISEREVPPTKESLGHQLVKLRNTTRDYPQFRQAAELYYQFNRDMVQYLHEKQMISTEDRNRFLEERDYCPQNRDMSDREGETEEGRQSRRPARADKSKLNRDPLFHRRLGSMRDIINPIQSTVQQVYEAHQKAAINDTFRAMDRLATQAGAAGNAIFERIPATDARAMQVNMREALRQAARDAGMTPNDTTLMLTNVENEIGQNVTTTLFTRVPTNEKGEKIVWFYENGKPVPAQLADGSLGNMMFEALTSMGEKNSGLLMGMLEKAAVVQRMGVTSSFSFIFRNVWVDSISSTINSPYARPFLTQASGMREVLRGGQYQQLYNRYAGMMGGAAYSALTQSVERDIKQLRDNGFQVRTPRSFRDFAGMVFKLGEFTETATRVGIFRNAMISARRDGMTEQQAAVEAAHYAHDVMDFSQWGSKSERTRRIIPFINAQAVGMDKFLKTLSGANDYGRLISLWQRYQSGQPISQGERRALGQAAKAWAITTLGLGTMSMFFWYLGQDDEDRDEIPDSIRATHWTVSYNDILYLLPKDWKTFIGDENGKVDGHARLPKPFEQANFANATERALDMAMKGDRSGGWGMLKDFWTTIAPPDSVPGLDLAYGFWANKDFFSGNDIIPKSEGGDRGDQFGPYTTETAKWIGKHTNISPYYIDHIVRGLFSNIGRDVTSAIDMAVGAGPKKPISEWPVASRFTYNAGRVSKSVQTMYDKTSVKESFDDWFWSSVSSDNQSFARAANSYKDRKHPGNEAEATRYLNTLSPDQRVFAIMNTDFEGRSGAKYRNLHPLLNARDGVTVLNGIMKEVVEGTITLGKGGKDEAPLKLSRTEMRDLRNELGHARKGFAQNGLRTLGSAGWDQQPMADVDRRLNVIKAMQSKVYEEMMTRLHKAKVLDPKDVAKAWPQVRDRVLAQRGEADVGDLYTAPIEAQ